LLARKRFRKRESNIACCGEMPFIGVIAKEVCYNLSKLADLYSGRRYTGPVSSYFSVFQDVSNTCNVAPTKSPLCRGIRLLIPRHIFRGCAAQWVRRWGGVSLLTVTKQKQPAGPPMTLGSMRELGVQRMIASCLNDKADP
jgi:hypothetical protein